MNVKSVIHLFLKMSEEDIPDSPAVRIEVEHENGVIRSLEGEEARAWIEFVGRAIGYYRQVSKYIHPPDVEWNEHE